jgi:tRNA A37 threonylcarbamoyladenosine synthetase subunit TsaC/SUA5/YrdC
MNGGYLGEQPTTVIDFSNDEMEVLRVGAGDPAPFS